MPRSIALCVLFLISLSIAPAWGQANRLGLAERFQQIDADGDGRLTPRELNRPILFKTLDHDGDGIITLDEGRAVRNRANVTAGADMDVHLDLAYGEHELQKLDLYAPKQSVEGAPVMLYVHGGGWSKGDKQAVGLKASFFTRHGWIFASTSYRLMPDGKHPKNLEDVVQAAAWLRENVAKHGGDPEKLFLMGHSAGAHLVALAGTDERPWKKAGLSLDAVRGVIPLDTQAYDIHRLIADIGPSPLYVGVFGEDTAARKDASPIHHIAKDKGIPPFLICYSSGLTKRVAPSRPQQANDFATAFRKVGVQAEVVDASDRTHGEINQRFGDPKDEKVTGRAMAFLEGILEEK